MFMHEDGRHDFRDVLFETDARTELARICFDGLHFTFLHCFVPGDLVLNAASSTIASRHNVGKNVCSQIEDSNAGFEAEQIS